MRVTIPRLAEALARHKLLTSEFIDKIDDVVVELAMDSEMADDGEGDPLSPGDAKDLRLLEAFHEALEEAIDRWATLPGYVVED